MNHRILSAVLVGWLCTTGCAAQQGREAPAPVPIGFAFITPEMQACADGALRGSPEPSVLPLAFTRFKEGCDLGDPAACSLLGVMYERGLAIPRSATTARSLFARSCNAGNHLGCSNLLQTAGLPPLPMPMTAQR